MHGACVQYALCNWRTCKVLPSTYSCGCFVPPILSGFHPGLPQNRGAGPYLPPKAPPPVTGGGGGTKRDDCGRLCAHCAKCAPIHFYILHSCPSPSSMRDHCTTRALHTISGPLITCSGWHLSCPLSFPLQKQKCRQMGESGRKWGNQREIGGGKWKKYLVVHLGDKNLANTDTDLSPGFRL